MQGFAGTPKRFLEGPTAVLGRGSILSSEVALYTLREPFQKQSSILIPKRKACPGLMRFSRNKRAETRSLLPHIETCDLLPNNQRPCRTRYALCHILYPVSAAHTSIFLMNSNSNFYAAPHAAHGPASGKMGPPRNRWARLGIYGPALE